MSVFDYYVCLKTVIPKHVVYLKEFQFNRLCHEQRENTDISISQLFPPQRPLCVVVRLGRRKTKTRSALTVPLIISIFDVTASGGL